MGRIASRGIVSIAMAAVLATSVVSAPGSVAAQGEADDRSDEQVLAERYAPVVMLKAQEHECDSRGEQWEPAPVEIVLDNPEVVLRQVGPGDPVLMEAPDASDLFGLGRGVYLDFPGEALRPGCLFEQDNRRFSAGTQPTVYAYVATQDDRPGQLGLQYWFFWYYNLWNNKHEGDWEGIQLLFDASTAAEALTMEPSAIGYAQHEGGERLEWDSSRLEREGDRPVVYPSAGSHASYFSQAVFLGRGPSEGFGCDDTTGPSRRLDPEVVVLPESVDDPDDPLAWLMFDGRWGERHPGPYNGPTGPRDKGRWTAPVDWHEGLRTSSVVVPAGDSRGAGIVQAFCTVVEWGSIQVIELQVSPIRLLVTVGLAAFVIWRLARRTSWDRVAPLPLIARRRGGQIVRAAGAFYRSRPAPVMMLGLVYLPVALVVGLAVEITRRLPLIGQLLDLGGSRSGTGLFLSLLVGGVANLFAYHAVSAGIAHLAATDAAGSVTGADAVRAVFARWRDLAAALVRAVVIVVLLFASVVGIPWGIRQVVRYQFVAQAVMVDGRAGAGALARSSELVRGRWFHTAVMTALFNATVVVASGLLGLLLLVVVQRIPLGLFSVLVTLTSALVVPLAAIAQTLLYGDAVAEREGQAAAEPQLVSR